MNIKDIEVGMYIRTDVGDIGKVVIATKERVVVHYSMDGEIFYDFNIHNAILKASHNIIKVIEVGDYVNGYKVTGIDEYDDNVLYLNNGEGSFEDTIFSTEIKSIVTKEYFEKGKFEVE